MRRLLLLSLLLLAALAAGCSGGDGDDGGEAAPTNTGGATTAAIDPEEYGEEDPQFGQLLVRFTKAAESGDVLGMWNLLSSATQASIGPSLEDFRTSKAREFEQGLGTLAAGAEIVLSRRIGDFGAAAIAADSELDGKRERLAYAVAFLQEEEEWKIELGGVVITGLRPEPLQRTGPQPELAANVGAGANLNHVLMFLDGEPFPTQRRIDSPFAARLTGKPAEALAAGDHTIVVFADSGLTGTALGWTFRVGEG